MNIVDKWLNNIFKIINFPLIIKQYGFFFSSNFISFGLKLGAGFLITKFTPPEVLGRFNSYGLSLGYFILLLLGIQDGLAKELPIYFGQNKKDEAISLASTTQIWSLLTGGFVSILLVTIGIISILQSNISNGIGWFVYAFDAFVLFFGVNYLQVTYRTSGDFSKLALSDILANIVSLVSVFFVSLFGFYGLCIRLILIDITRISLLSRWRPIHVKPRLNKKNFKLLISSGLPIYISSQIYSWWGLLNLTLIFLLLNTKEYGVFQIAIIVSSATEIVVISINQIIYPRVAEKYGRLNSQKGLFFSLIRTSGILFCAILIISTVGWLITPWFVSNFLPNYMDGVPAAQWALLATIPLSIQPLVRLFFILKKTYLYMICTLSGMIIYLVQIYGFQNRLELINFPKSLFVGRLVFSIFLILTSIILIKKEPKKIV